MAIRRIFAESLPGRFRTWLKVVPSLIEARSQGWSAGVIEQSKVVRHGGYFAFDDATRTLAWARAELSYPTKYAYTINDAEVTVPTGRISTRGRWLVESFGNPIKACCEVPFIGISRVIAKAAGRIAKLEDTEDGYIFCRFDRYAHFVFESLVALLHSLELQPGACVLVEKKPFEGCAYFRQYLELLMRSGIVKNLKTVDADFVKAPKLTFTAYEQDSGTFSKESIGLLKRAFLSGGVGERGGRKIFITRRDGRQFENQKELEASAAGNGFEVVDTSGFDIADEINLFSGAGVVVANHGAALANVVYCPSGARVVELFSQKWQNDFYSRLAKLCDLRYSHVTARESGKWGWCDVSFKEL